MILKKEYAGKYVLFSFLSILAAGGNMGIVYMINRVVDGYFRNALEIPGDYLFLFIMALLLFFACRTVAARGIIRFTQQVLRKTREEMLEMVIRSAHGAVIKDKARIFSALTRDADNVVAASVSIVDIFTNSIVILICFIYMGLLSWKLLCGMLIILCFTLGIYFYSERKARKLFVTAMGFYDVFVRNINEILAGFKEISMERRKGIEIMERHVRPAINGNSATNQQAQLRFLTNRIIGQMAFYFFIGTLLLFLGSWLEVEKSVIVSFIFLILYIWSPIETVVLLIPNLSQARISMQRINDLETRIRTFETEAPQQYLYTGFSEIVMSNIVYHYGQELNNADEAPFEIGPVNFRLLPGEVIFISGGNGSGKTTFMNILIGLCSPSGGEILVDEQLIDPAALQDYHSLFATVFNDFHLFEELYGVAEKDPVMVMELLQLMDLEHKVSFSDGKFSTIHLSAGQRKRLALICAVLEKKPILVLDEFAADQDPYFKRKFYTEVLPFLKENGITIIAITHDDQYYYCADKLYKMEEGQLSIINPTHNFQTTAIGS
ncbi:cyclic peptide export ABC transporter [Chitinophaga sp.]|uniref:cyclic peptide export ABC transporter n=1 Tax=Chitinophaga sp. TaxID=1869181 RepID=UPI0031E30DED